MSISRRRLLQWGAASALLAPFGALLNGAAGGDGPPARRLLIFATPNGCAPGMWQFDAEDPLVIRPGSVLDPLRGLESWLLPVTDLDFASGPLGHSAMRTMLTVNTPSSFDQMVADLIGGDSRFRSLELGVHTSFASGSENSRMVYRNQRMMTPDDLPQNVFRRVYGGPDDHLLQSNRASMLDVSAAEIAQLQSLLGAEERARLEVHLDSVRAVERSLFSGVECSALTVSESAGFDEDMASQVQLAVHALACEATRVVTLQASVSGSPTVFSWLGLTDSHHGYSHGDARHGFLACQQWYAAQFRALLQGLIDLPDATTGRPLIEDTIVMWVTEMADGRLHTDEETCFLLAGGPLRAGRRIRAYDSKHEQVYKAVGEIMGAPVDFGRGRPAMRELT